MLVLVYLHQCSGWLMEEVACQCRCASVCQDVEIALERVEDVLQLTSRRGL